MARCGLRHIFATILLSICAVLYIGAFAIGIRALDMKIDATCNSEIGFGDTALFGNFTTYL